MVMRLSQALPHHALTHRRCQDQRSNNTTDQQYSRPEIREQLELRCQRRSKVGCHEDDSVQDQCRGDDHLDELLHCRLEQAHGYRDIQATGTDVKRSILQVPGDA